MSGVNIPACSINADGVAWVASWDSEGQISCRGIDKDGKELTDAEAPSEVKSAARAYGATFGGEGNGGKPAEGKTDKNNEEKPEDILVIETNKDGTLKYVSIAEVNWTEKQKEFVEKCLRAAAMNGRENGKDEKGGNAGETSAKGNNSEIASVLKEIGADKVTYSSKDGELTFRDKDGKEIKVPKEVAERVGVLLRGKDTDGNVGTQRTDDKTRDFLKTRPVKTIARGEEVERQSTAKEIENIESLDKKPTETLDKEAAQYLDSVRQRMHDVRETSDVSNNQEGGERSLRDLSGRGSMPNLSQTPISVLQSSANKLRGRTGEIGGK